MRILVRHEDFSSEHYNLTVGQSALILNGENQSYTFSYQDIRDFCVTHGKQGKTYFTMLSGGRMFEGQVLNAADVEPFTAALQKKLGGIINIEVKRI